VLELITSSFVDIMITENGIKDLHNRLLKFSEKDEWHRGNYKQHANHVEASLPDGSKQIIFQTTSPGFPTTDAMSSLLEWYHSDIRANPLIKCAVFVYEFLSIHPFQDGNGRLSRLLATLLLLKNGFTWIQYISFEHEIENKKTEYYAVLRACQSRRPHEDVTLWVQFFLNCLSQLQQHLMEKLQYTSAETTLSPRVKSILVLIRERPGIQSGELAQRLGIPNPTIKKILSELVNQNLIEKKGLGRGTSYLAR
jgi:Fic family protein